MNIVLPKAMAGDIPVYCSHDEIVDVMAVIPNPKNPNRHPDSQVEVLAKIIKSQGWRKPITVSKRSGFVVSGHGRLLAAIMLKTDKVPIDFQDYATEAEEYADLVADNRIAELSEIDDSLLSEILGEIKEYEDFNFELTGYADHDLEEILNGIDFGEETEAETVEDDYEVELPEEPKAKKGDIYQLGRHRLMCGDSTKNEDIHNLMESNKADMILSDPPYGMFLDTDFSSIKGSLNSIGRQNKTTGNKYSKVIGDNEDFKTELIDTFFDNFGYCKEMFLFGSDYFAELIPNRKDGSWLVWDKRKESQADAIGSEFELIWSKSKHKRRMMRFDWFGFLSSQDGQDARNRVHPTQKPVSLLKSILEQWGNDGDIVVDLYGGSGSTLIACEQAKRKCYMMEIDPQYIDVIIDRWEKFTGEKAILLESEERSV